MAQFDFFLFSPSWWTCWNPTAGGTDVRLTVSPSTSSYARVTSSMLQMSSPGDTVQVPPRPPCSYPVFPLYTPYCLLCNVLCCLHMEKCEPYIVQIVVKYAVQHVDSAGSPPFYLLPAAAIWGHLLEPKISTTQARFIQQMEGARKENLTTVSLHIMTVLFFTVSAGSVIELTWLSVCLYVCLISIPDAFFFWGPNITGSVSRPLVSEPSLPSSVPPALFTCGLRLMDGPCVEP